MSIQLEQLLDTFERLWPRAGADDWDAPGLLVGDPRTDVSRVLLSVDATLEVIEEAGGFDLVLSHHPALLRGITTANESTAKGKLIANCVRQNLALFAAHTNADIVEGGVSDTLAQALGLQQTQPLVPSQHSSAQGHGRIGNSPDAITVGDLARSISRVLPATATGIRVSGDYSASISRIALCAGAGDAFLSQALEQGADAYITSDLRHHVVQEVTQAAKATGRNFAIFDISHWAAEWLWLEVAASRLQEIHPEVEFVVSDLRTDPWDFVITQ